MIDFLFRITEGVASFFIKALLICIPIILIIGGIMGLINPLFNQHLHF